MLRIGTKLGISYGVLGALCVVTGIVSYQQTQVVRQKMEDVVKVREPVNSAVHALQHILTESAFATLGYLSTGDSALLVALHDNMDRFGQIEDRFRQADTEWADSAVGGKLEGGFARVKVMASEQVNLRDIQRLTMQSLLQDLDAIDALLTERIQAAVTIHDPVAYRRLQSVLEMKSNINAITRGLATFLATGEPQFELRFQQAEKEFDRYFQIYRAVLLSSEEKRWAVELQRRASGALSQAQSVFALDKERRSHLSGFLVACRQLNTLLDERVLQRTERSLSEAQADLLRAGEQAKASILIALVASLAFGLGAGYVTTRNITEPLRQLSSVMLAIARGDRAEEMTPATTDEVRALRQAFDLMTGRLLKASAELQEAERERLATLRHFAQSVQRVQEEERARISRELHDDLCQRLSGMKFRVEALQDEILPADKRAQRTLRDFTQELERTIIDVRRISSNLRPSALDDFGLVIALKMLCKDFQTIHSLRTEFEHGSVPSRRLDPSIEIALYRIAQEALSNAAEHAGASDVTVRLIYDDSLLRLVVQDNGRGFASDATGQPRSTGRGFGLISMRERTELLGGTFQIESNAGKGTTIMSIVPCEAGADNEKDQDPHRG
jgi:signal transduction histidine kinase